MRIFGELWRNEVAMIVLFFLFVIEATGYSIEYYNSIRLSFEGNDTIGDRKCSTLCFDSSIFEL